MRVWPARLVLPFVIDCKLARTDSKSGQCSTSCNVVVSDYITEAPSPICQFLARLFTSMLRHGFMPLSFRDAIIQQIRKEFKDPSLSANYRGIALASSLSSYGVAYSSHLGEVLHDK